MGDDKQHDKIELHVPPGFQKMWSVLALATRGSDDQDFVKQTIILAPSQENAIELAWDFCKQAFPTNEYYNARVEQVSKVDDYLIRGTGIYQSLLGTLNGLKAALLQTVLTLEKQLAQPPTPDA